MLIPTFTKGFDIKNELSIPPRKPVIDLNFKNRELSVEELLSIAFMGNTTLPVDQTIAEKILEELIDDIKALL